MDRLTETRAILRQLVAFQTVSTDPNLALIDWLAGHLETLGARDEVFGDASGSKANLFATLGPEGDGGIVLSGHTDVVPVADQDWSSDPWELREEGGLLYGRGTCDMKGFIAATLVAARDYAAADLRRPLHFAFTYDEEVGCLGARDLVGTLTARGLKPAMAIIGEPTEMRVVEGHKGCHEYTTRFVGAEGHGSAPDLGVNAAEYAARYVGRLLDLREALKPRAPATSRFEPPWTTINIGGIHGGVAHNVIVGKAEVEWEMRPVQPSDADFVRDGIAAYAKDVLLPAMRAVDPDASIETEVVGEVVGLTPMDENAARDLVAELTGANGADVVAFGTEAGLFQGMGMSAVVCGPGSIRQAHRPDEFVAEDQLAACLDMLAGLGRKLV
jgi:acetylornithine deacetylase